MPWDETNCMNERVRFIAAHLEAGEPFSALCEGFGVSRKTGYKWVERYELEAVAGLEERSRAPLSHPHAVAKPTTLWWKRCLESQEETPRVWGPRKLRVILQRHYPQLALPAASTSWRSSCVRMGSSRSDGEYGGALRDGDRHGRVREAQCGVTAPTSRGIFRLQGSVATP